jgi:hypothetical protein
MTPQAIDLDDILHLERTLESARRSLCIFKGDYFAASASEFGRLYQAHSHLRFAHLKKG